MSTEKTQENNKVTLYIATHNKTGFKYFGKTTMYFTKEDLQKYYHGSGVYWNNHLKKHGDDVTMEIHGIYSSDKNSEDYVKPIALKFSEENSIVENYNKWANLIPEDGIGGGNNGLSSEDSKRAVAKRNFTMNNTILQNGLTIKEQRNLDHKETINTEEYKNTIGKLRVEKQVITRSKLDKDGVSGYSKSNKKGCQTRSTTILENGLTIEEDRERKRQITIEKNGRWFKLYKNSSEPEIISYKNLRKISQNLVNANKHRPMGFNKRSISNLKRVNKEHLIGWFVEEILS